MLEAYHGAVEHAVIKEVNDLESPAAWATLRPAACTLGLAGICFSVIHSTHCAAEQLAFVFFRSPLFTLFTLISTPTVANARRVLSIPDCRLCAWSRLFLQKFSTEALLVGCDARACLIALGVLLKWEISKQECRHGQLRRFCLASESWLPLLHQLSAQFLLMRHRLLERVLKPKAPACSTSGSRSKRWSSGAVRKRKGKIGKQNPVRRLVVGEPNERFSRIICKDTSVLPTSVVAARFSEKQRPPTETFLLKGRLSSLAGCAAKAGLVLLATVLVEARPILRLARGRRVVRASR